jgi:DNA-binding NarL/FixJ family response regulator
MTRVLIVDDQPLFRRHLRELLTHAGLTVIAEAGDIPTAKELAQELQPDIAVVDVMLPGQSGIEGTPYLKALVENLRVFLISAHHDRAQIFHQSAADVGAEAFIAKDDLDLEVVKSWVRTID